MSEKNISQLAVVASNSTPAREQRYPDRWLLYTSSGAVIEVIVAHDRQGRPHIACHDAA